MIERVSDTEYAQPPHGGSRRKEGDAPGAAKARRVVLAGHRLAHLWAPPARPKAGQQVPLLLRPSGPQGVRQSRLLLAPRS